MKRHKSLLLGVGFIALTLMACSSGKESSGGAGQETAEQQTTKEKTTEALKTSSAEKRTEKAEEEGVFTYTYENGVITISGKGVLDEEAMQKCGAVEEGIKTVDEIKVVLEEGVTEIGDKVFDGCSSMKEITLPEGITEIGDYAFRECGFTEIMLPKTLKKIGEMAFFGTSIKEITIPDGMTKIERGVFNADQDLESVTLPDSIREIGDFAFANTKLKKIDLPKNLTGLGKSAFESCLELSGSIVIPDGVKEIKEKAFYWCPITDVTIPEGVTEIGDSAFEGCDLTSVKIPESVTRIGKQAFWANDITSVDVSTEKTLIASNAFEGNVKIGSGTSTTGSEETNENGNAAENSDGSALLAFLKEQYENGYAYGETPKRSYFPSDYMHNIEGSLGLTYAVGNTIYFYKNRQLNVYDIANKTLTFCENFNSDLNEFRNGNLIGYLNGWFYYFYNYNGKPDTTAVLKINPEGEVKTVTMTDILSPGAIGIELREFIPFSKGLLIKASYRPDENSERKEEYCILSEEELTLTGTVATPEYEAAHGFKEPVELSNFREINGEIYGTGSYDNKMVLYRLDADSMAWTEMGSPSSTFNFMSFYGNCAVGNSKFYNRLTGDEIFNPGDLYLPSTVEGELSYFGGDKYIGNSNNDYRWIDPVSGTMSEPLKFPEKFESLFIVNDTYCVYRDEYGIFLWNYNTGNAEEEQEISLFK